MNEKNVQSQKLRTREGFGTRTPDAMINSPGSQSQAVPCFRWGSLRDLESIGLVTSSI